MLLCNEAEAFFGVNLCLNGLLSSSFLLNLGSVNGLLRLSGMSYIIIVLRFVLSVEEVVCYRFKSCLYRHKMSCLLFFVGKWVGVRASLSACIKWNIVSS